MKQNAARITAAVAAGSVASPYFVPVLIEQRLCSPACVDQIPLFNPVFTLQSYSQVGTNQYTAKVLVEGTISYSPCGSNCQPRTQLVRQVFDIDFASTTAPTAVSITVGQTTKSIIPTACQSCSRDFVAKTPITLTVSVAA